MDGNEKSLISKRCKDLVEVLVGKIEQSLNDADLVQKYSAALGEVIRAAEYMEGVSITRLNSPAVRQDEWTGPIQAWVDPRESPIFLHELLEDCLKISTQDAPMSYHRAGRVLRSIGYVPIKKKIDKKAVSVWVKESDRLGRKRYERERVA
jgi:hypothetical protein